MFMRLNGTRPFGSKVCLLSRKKTVKLDVALMERSVRTYVLLVGTPTPVLRGFIRFRTCLPAIRPIQTFLE